MKANKLIFAYNNYTIRNCYYCKNGLEKRVCSSWRKQESNENTECETSVTNGIDLYIKPTDVNLKVTDAFCKATDATRKATDAISKATDAMASVALPSVALHCCGPHINSQVNVSIIQLIQSQYNTPDYSFPYYNQYAIFITFHKCVEVFLWRQSPYILVVSIYILGE